MGFLDVFKDGQYKNKYEELQKQYGFTIFVNT